MVQLYRYPGLTQSKAKTLLRKVWRAKGRQGHKRRLQQRSTFRSTLRDSLMGGHASVPTKLTLPCVCVCVCVQAQEKASNKITGIDGELVRRGWAAACMQTLWTVAAA